MIEKDRQLLRRMATINQGLGEIVLRMTDRQDGGELNPDDLRVVGGGLFALGRDMLARADELAHRLTEQPPALATGTLPSHAYAVDDGALASSAGRLSLADLLEQAAAQLRQSVTRPDRLQPQEPPERPDRPPRIAAPVRDLACSSSSRREPIT